MKPRETLSELPDVARITVHPGQVLVYPRHTPPGIFVVLAGVMCRFADGTVPEAACGDLRDAAEGPFALPAPDEVGEPAHAGVAATTDAELLFVPRSVVLARADVPRILAEAGIEVLPLRETPRQRGEAVTRRKAR
jgi:CRP-like cAMP-binding protein